MKTMILIAGLLLSQLALAQNQESPGFEGTDSGAEAPEFKPRQPVKRGDETSIDLGNNNQDEFLKNWHKRNQMRPDIMQLLLQSSGNITVGKGQLLLEYLSERMAHPKDNRWRETTFSNHCEIQTNKTKVLECTLYVSSTSIGMLPSPQGPQQGRSVYEQHVLNYHVISNGKGGLAIQEKNIPIFSY